MSARSTARTIVRALPPGVAWRLRDAVDLAERPVLPARRRLAGEHLPVPPRLLRGRVGAPALAPFLQDGRATTDALTLLARDHAGIDLADAGAVLDFGSGCGRTLRHLVPGSRSVWHACDVDAAAIGWLQSAMPQVSSAANRALPPAPFPDGSLDVVYSISIFTHLDEPSQRAWLQDIRRLLRPGGVALLTTHGPEVGARRAGADGPAIAEQVARDGFGFAVDRRIAAAPAGHFPGFSPRWGCSAQTHDRTRRVWSQELQIDTIVPEALNWGQDLVVARRP